MSGVYRVTGALVVVEVADPRREVYLEAGARVPDAAVGACVERLARDGLVELVDQPDLAPAAKPEPALVLEPEPAVAVPDFGAMNLDQIRTYAADHGIDLGGATRKDDIIAALTAA